MKITAIILAAGQSKRMGDENKLLKMWNGFPLIEHVCRSALASECENVIVVSGFQQHEIERCISGYDLNTVHNEDFASGMASSIGVGIQATGKCDAVIILLGDMPGISTQMINQLLETAQGGDAKQIVVSTSDGKRGNPLLWPEYYFDELKSLNGDSGAKQIIAKYHDCIVVVELGRAARFDLDTPQAFKSTEGL